MLMQTTCTNKTIIFYTIIK